MDSFSHLKAKNHISEEKLIETRVNKISCKKFFIKQQVDNTVLDTDVV